MKKNSLFVKLSTLAVAALFGSVGMAFAETTIATVNIQQALHTVDAGKKAKELLEKEADSKKKELEAEDAALKKMSEDFKKKAPVMSEAARMKRQSELQERFMKFQEKVGRVQAEFQNREREVSVPLLNEMRKVIAKIAKEAGYSAVLDENSVLFSLEKNDITKKVITEFNKDHT